MEHTLWQHYQYVIYVIGLFHLKIACADVIWWIFIEPKEGQEDMNSLMHFVALHWPKEIRKVGRDPSFHRMHEVIMHTGAALCLDAWCVKVKHRNPPTFADVVKISEYLALHYVTGAKDLNIYKVQTKATSQQDQQHKNILQMLFPPWVYIFKAVGKHKYTSHMVKFMTDVHFVYPAPLRHAICYMPNPKEQVTGVCLKESLSIQIYSLCCYNIECNFQLTSFTSKQEVPDMTKTLAKMGIYLEEHGPNEYRAG
ncbi:hypothetical protein C8R45DRAFT_1057425 [Mycena sanguinolenta]|nr:hypothetical protein C8R45DRAFT_1057425 [Mycena sanguinolenta]